MKRRFAMILIISAALVFSGCQGKTAVPEETAAAEEAGAVGTEAPGEAETGPDEAEVNPFDALFAETADFPLQTAGSSMKAAGLQERFLSTVFVYGFTKAEDAADMVRSAYDSLDADQKDRFRDNFKDVVDAGIRSALEDFSSVESTFDDAGIRESMQTLLDAPDIGNNWESFSGAVGSLFE